MTVHPIKSTNTLTSAFTTTNGSAEVTITFSGAHGISASDIVLLDNFSTITGSNLAHLIFDNKKFMVTTVPTSTTITITMPSNESGSGATTYQVVLEFNIIIRWRIQNCSSKRFWLVTWNLGW